MTSGDGTRGVGKERRELVRNFEASSFSPMRTPARAKRVLFTRALDSDSVSMPHAGISDVVQKSPGGDEFSTPSPARCTSVFQTSNKFGNIGTDNSTLESCAVCLSPLEYRADMCSRDRGVLFETPCMHTFHKGCLQQCRATYNNHCPLCRSLLPRGLTPPGVFCRPLNEKPDDPTLFVGGIVGRVASAREAVRQSLLQNRHPVPGGI